MLMREYRFRITIPAHEYIAHYQGVARNVVVTLSSGLTVQFPSEALRPFVTHNGVQGEFLLRVDKNNKMKGLERVGD